jgi:hypothetical protein
MYPAVYGYITMRLQDSAADIDIAGGAIDGEIGSVIRKTLQGYNVAYADVTPGDDLDNLNEAVALLVCARLITPLSTGGLNYDVTSEKLETISRGTAATSGGGEKARWEEEAAQCLALISFITTQAPPLNTFALNGPKRKRVELWGSY